jgi:hypothetical protein
MHEALPESQGDLVALRTSGALQAPDYVSLISLLEKRIQEHGTIRLLWEMHNSGGQETDISLPDLAFDLTLLTHFTRIALVGENAWLAPVAEFIKPFTTANVRFFELTEAEKALHWVKADD